MASFGKIEVGENLGKWEEKKGSGFILEVSGLVISGKA
jgi:hypothetical protein